MRRNSKGFTLMEMLIVVAIIAILISIAIPTFSNMLEKSREAVDMANIRSAYAMLMATYIDGTDVPRQKLSVSANANGALVGKVVIATTTDKSYQPDTYVTVVRITQKKAGWQSLKGKLEIGEYSWELTKSALNTGVKYLYIGMDNEGKIYRVSPHQQ